MPSDSQTQDESRLDAFLLFHDKIHNISQNDYVVSGSPLPPVFPETETAGKRRSSVGDSLPEVITDVTSEVARNSLEVPNISITTSRRRSSNNALVGRFGRPATMAPVPPGPRRDSDQPGPTVNSSAKGLLHASWRHKLVLFCLLLGDTMAFMGFSLLAPFFPSEAASRGISSTTSGWIFAVFPLMQFITSPLVGKLIPKCGAKFTLIMGAFVCGTSTIAFGFLDYIADVTMFTCFCFLTRIVLAIGASFWATASFTIATEMFSDNPATAMALLETASGVGQMIGPALGGALYEASGFQLPFIVLGGMTLAMLPLFVSVLKKSKDSDGASRAGESGLTSLLRVPTIAVTCTSVWIVATLWSSLDPILELHLKEYNMSSMLVGVVFLSLSLIYSICSPLIGCLADRMKDSSALLVVGHFLLFVAFLFMGPAPVLNMPRTEYPWFTFGSVFVLGVGLAFAIVPTFDKIFKSAGKAGLNSNTGFHAAVAGLWMACYSLGETVGPTLSGWLNENQGFAQTNAYLSLIAFVTGIMLMGLWIGENRTLCTDTQDDRVDLLQTMVDSSVERDTQI